MSRFQIHVKGRNRYFPTLEAAQEFANKYFQRTGIVLGIVEVKA